MKNTPLPATTLLLFAAIAHIATGQEGDATPPDPGQLQFTKWTPDFEVPDPVAISIDAQGRAFVTQTQRRKAQDLDIRNNRDWIPNDVGFQSVDEKRAFFLERLDPANSAANTARVADYNGDGSHDYRDLMQLSERIYLIRDTDGSGTADSISVFAEDFKSEVTGIAAGVLVHEGDVYATIAPDVWKMSDTDGDGIITGDERSILATGFGLHIAYGGHDMHGLTVGPDGKIYWSIGDKGISAVSREGEKFHYPNQGGVMRCNPDGSDFEVYAHGLRNVQELAFDDYGNLFGVDNDSDREGEMERFVYIVRDMDAGWRCNYQYRSGDDFNPWTDEKLWHTHHEGQPAYIVPPIRHYKNGPAGFTRDPGTALSPAYRGYFFLTSAPNGQQYAFQVKAAGASFEMINEHQIGDGTPLVGINFGPDGALYGVDWGGGYPLNEKGAVWKIDVPEFDQSQVRLDTAERLRESFTQHSFKQLVRLLDHPDQRVRLKAQFQLAKLGNPLIPVGVALDGSQPELARVHALWTLVQMRQFTPRLNDMAEEPNSELRAQFAKLAGESGRHINIYVDSLVRLTTDPSQRVQFFAALGLGKLLKPNEQAGDALLKLIDQLEPQQSYLRHACVTGLAGAATADQIAALNEADSYNRRMCAVLALRRIQSPLVAGFLADADPLIAIEAARAIHDDFSIVGALPALAATLDAPATHDQRFIRRALNAALRLGDPANAERVAKYVTQTNDDTMRVEALDLLSTWLAPDAFDRVDGRIREFQSRNSAPITTKVAPFLSKWLARHEADIQAAALRIAAHLKYEVKAADLLAVLSRKENPAPLRIEALNSLAAQQAESLNDAIDLALDSDAPDLRIRAGQLLAGTAPDRARDRLSVIAADHGAPTAERQAAFHSLAVSERGDAILTDWLNRIIKGDVPPALQLDILTAAESRQQSSDSIRTVLEKYSASLPTGDLAAAYQVCLEGGSKDRGRDIFLNHIAAQCTACHKSADGKGSNVGPNLKSVGRKHPPEYLLESLINPQAVIAKGYGMISLTKHDGTSIAATLRKESETGLELRDAEGKTTKIALGDIAQRGPVVSTMPPMIGLLSKAEIRDLIAYLKTLRAE